LESDHHETENGVSRELGVVIMAAGKGTRMKNPDLAKVMYTVADVPMIDHVVELAVQLSSSRTIVVVGWKKESVIAHLAELGKPVVCVEQTPQLGSGHAVMQAAGALEGFSGDVLVLSGDVPLLSAVTANRLIEFHRSHADVATVLTAMLGDPTGYGRIMRNGAGHVVGIVEQKDATPDQRQIREINSGIYVFEKDALFEGLTHITPENAQKEYYLTDVFKYFWRNKMAVHAVPADDHIEIQGINTIEQLEQARAAYANRAAVLVERAVARS
jgi:UDP-N-acetylglucosamine pyrophosphorylase